MIGAELRSVGAGLKSYEVPQNWGLVNKGFNAHRGMLTPKLSLKRSVVMQHHGDELMALYDDPKRA